MRTSLITFSLFVLIHTASAFYDPEVGRWFNRDPIGEAGGENLYVYVDNDPINGIDPTGLINWMTEWWADFSVNGSWWQKPIGNVLGPISAVVPDSIGWSASGTGGFGPGVTSGYNDQGFISKPCPEAARYNLIGAIVGTPQATVDAQVSLGWSFNSSDKSGPDSWKGWFTGFQLGVGPYVFSASLGDGWFNFTYGVGGPPGFTFQSFATYYDLVQKY